MLLLNKFWMSFLGIFALENKKKLEKEHFKDIHIYLLNFIKDVKLFLMHSFKVPVDFNYFYYYFPIRIFTLKSNFSQFCVD